MTATILERPQSPIMLMRREHKQLLDQLAPQAPTRVRCCAAHLMSYLQHWHEWKKTLYPTNWIYQPLLEIRSDLMDAYTIHVIRDAIDLLQELGFLSIRKNSRAENWRNGQDKTHQYFLHSDRIEAALENRFSPSAAETPEKSPFVNSETSGVNSETSDANSETSRFIDEIHTQIPTQIPATNSCSLSKEREKIDFVQELEDPWELPANELKQGLMSSCKEIDGISQEQNSGLDKNSAAYASNYVKTAQNELNLVPKLKSDRSSGFQSDEERDDFYQVLLELAKGKGVRSPAGWASAIVRSINAGEPCQYLSEYREGLQVGNCERQEWEISPGQPFPQFISYLKASLKKTGMSDQEAIAAAHHQLSDVNLARSQWESCKRTINRCKEDWEKQHRLGVATPYLPPELMPHREVSFEQAAITMHTLQSSSAQVRELASSFSIESLPAVTPELSPTTEDQNPDQELPSSKQQVCLRLEEPAPKPATALELQEKLNRPVMAPAIRIMVRLNPQWGYRIEEDLVLPVEGAPSLDHLRSLHHNPITKAKVEQLVEVHPEWGFYIDGKGELRDF